MTDASNPGERSERLWGKDGWVEIQKLLAELRIRYFRASRRRQDRARSCQKKIQKPLWKLVTSGQLKQPRISIEKSPSVLHNLALGLGQTINHLWIHSEISFEILHGAPAQKYGAPARDQELSHSVPVRQGAIALYQACQRSTAHCDVDIGLLGDRSLPTDSQFTSDTNLIYHIIVESGNISMGDLWDITAESFNFPMKTTISPTIEIHEEPDLEILKSSMLSSSHFICLQPGYSKVNHYFCVGADHTATGSVSRDEVLALELDHHRTSLRAQNSISVRSVTMRISSFGYPVARVFEHQATAQSRDKRRTGLRLRGRANITGLPLP